MIPNFYIGKKIDLPATARLYMPLVAMWEYEPDGHTQQWRIVKNRLNGHVGIVPQAKVLEYSLKLIENWANAPSQQPLNF